MKKARPAGNRARDAVRKSANPGPQTLRIEYRSVDSLIPYGRNPRTHSDEQVAQIAASIREFGFTNPVLVDGENGVIAGHGQAWRPPAASASRPSRASSSPA